MKDRQQESEIVAGRMNVCVRVMCGGEWIEPPLLDEPQLLRGMNAAAVLKVSVIKSGGLSFAEGNRIEFLVDGEEIFSGRVFSKRRCSEQVIEVVAYDEVRYLQNRDCCVFVGESPEVMLQRIAAMLNLPLGDVAQVDWKPGVRVFDGRRYIDMLASVLDEVLVAKGRHFVVLAEYGKLCLRDCRKMECDICLDLGSFAGYEYKTTIDENYANRVKLIYEDRRKAARREFVAEDRADVAEQGVLQYVHKNAVAEEATNERARELLASMNLRQEKLTVSHAPGDVAVRGGSIVWVCLNLGDKVVDCQALVKSAKHYFKSGNCFMDLELDCSLF